MSERPPRADTEAVDHWLDIQQQSLAVIHLSCDRDQKHLIAECDTGFDAWETLADTYASNDISNVMRLEEQFGRAKKKDNQTMSQWISHIKNMASQLREVGVDVSTERVTNRILNGLDKAYQSLRYSLRARAGPLKVEVVTQMLLAADMELREERENAVNMKTTAATYQGANTTINYATQANPPGAQRTSVPSYRRAPYARTMRDQSQPSSLQCYHCNNYGHTSNTCWIRFPHLKPQWMKDAEEWRRQRSARPHHEQLEDAEEWRRQRSARPHHEQLEDAEEWRRQRSSARPHHEQLESQASSSTALVFRKANNTNNTALPAHVDQQQQRPGIVKQRNTTQINEGYQTSYQNPSFLGNTSVETLEGYVGPSGARVDKHASCYVTLADLNGKRVFGKEFAHSIRLELLEAPQEKEEGGVGPLDEPGKWLVDTGASNHYSPFKHLFLSLIPCDEPVEVLTGNGWVYAYHYGTIALIINVNGLLQHVHLENVLYVPALQARVNLFSVIVVADRGYTIDFSRAGVKFRLDGQTLATGTRIGNSWWFDCDIRSYEICMAIRDTGKGGDRPETEQTWHQRMGHLNKSDLSKLPSMSTGIAIGNPPVSSKMQCTGCLVGKQHRTISRIPRKRPNRRLEVIHADICGPIQRPGYIGEHRYFRVFVDGYSRFVWVYCLKTKDEIRNAFREFKAVQQNYTGLRIFILFTDGEKSLMDKEFQADLLTDGILHQTTQAYSPEMNGTAENAIKQIVQRASSMMWGPKIPIGFWPEAVRMAAFLKNRSPHKTIGCTPYEAWFGNKPNLSYGYLDAVVMRTWKKKIERSSIPIRLKGF